MKKDMPSGDARCLFSGLHEFLAGRGRVEKGYFSTEMSSLSAFLDHTGRGPVWPVSGS